MLWKCNFHSVTICHWGYTKKLFNDAGAYSEHSAAWCICIVECYVVLCSWTDNDTSRNMYCTTQSVHSAWSVVPFAGTISQQCNSRQLRGWGPAAGSAQIGLGGHVRLSVGCFAGRHRLHATFCTRQTAEATCAESNFSGHARLGYYYKFVTWFQVLHSVTLA